MKTFILGIVAVFFMLYLYWALRKRLSANSSIKIKGNNNSVKISTDGESIIIDINGNKTTIKKNA